MLLFTLFSCCAARAAHVARPARLGGFLLLALLLAGPARAQTSSFALTGAPQTYVVPAGASQLQVVATGAYNGAVVRATVAATPGETLTVMVGGQGVTNSVGSGGGGATFRGYNGGGASPDGGRGGGATDLRRSGTSTGDYLTSRNALLVAGGGGSGGNAGPVARSSFAIQNTSGNGGAGGTPNGGNGTGAAGYIGTGASQTAVGASASGAASNNVGGAGNTYGGNGGGGYYGGGSGKSTISTSPYNCGGGGGGSSWVMASGTAISYATSGAFGDGSLTITPIITYTAAPVVTAPANSGTVATATPTYSGTAAASSTVVVYVDGASIGSTTASAGGSWSLVQPTALASGSHTVYATAQGSGLAVSASSGTNTFTVVLTPTITSFTPTSGPVGTAVTITGSNLGSASNVRFNGTAQTTFTSNTPTQIVLNVPAGATTGTLTATTPAGTSAASSQTFTVVPPPTITSVSPASELPGKVVTITGTGFAAGSTVSFGGTGAGVTYVSATQLTATVPAALAEGSAPVSVTTSGSTSTAQSFSVLAVYNGGTLGACAAAVPATASLNDGAWHYLFSGTGQVVAAYSYTGASLGNLAIDVLRADAAQPVRKDPRNHYYLDRNWHLTASAGPFAGRSVSLRLYGLASEQARLQAADAAATLAGLKATQYSGPNEDCALANDVAAAEHRTLAAPATQPAGTAYFVAELTVADHFSEFYLTGSATPLPVELTQFTATASGPSAVRLAWATASEKNSQQFEVERSLDGTRFERLATVAAAGNSSSARAYEHTDTQVPKTPSPQDPIYYRLRQVDADGTFSYSPVRAVGLTGAAEGLSLYPNPAPAGTATLKGVQPGTVVTVFDALGREVASAPADAAGTAAIKLPAGRPAGMYVVRAGSKALRLTVE
ncbi:hypothetical protein GCM10028824_38090 [Hymenobacter segetis]|uniref:receptor protein-tyrosine kinase n=1 Tax=Hymenobacter segetis TaxID=2025509 RepID=A0ABU9LTI0_9BACT